MKVEIDIPGSEYCAGCRLSDSSAQCNYLGLICPIEGREGMPVDYNPHNGKYKVLKHKDCPGK